MPKKEVNEENLKSFDEESSFDEDAKSIEEISEEAKTKFEAISIEESEPQEQEELTEEKEEVKEEPEEEEKTAKELEDKETKPPEDKSEKGKFRRIKADGEYHEIAEEDVDRRLSMAIHAEQKLAKVNQMMRTYEEAIKNARNMGIPSEASSKEIKEERLPPELQKWEVTEDDELDGMAEVKNKHNAMVDFLLQQQKENEQLRNIVGSQEDNLYANELKDKFSQTEAIFKEEKGIELDNTAKDKNGYTARDRIQDAVLMYLDRGQRFLQEHPEWFQERGLPLAYTMEHAFYEWLGTQTSVKSTSKEITAEEIAKNEDLFAGVIEIYHSMKDEDREENKVIKKTGAPISTGKDVIDEIVANKEPGKSVLDKIAEAQKRKYAGVV